MYFRTLFDSLKSRLTKRRTRRSPRAKDRLSARRLLLEGLEDRRLMAFDIGANYSVGDSPQAIVTADFNNDGRVDMATANFLSDSVSVLLGKADGTFQTALTSTTGASPLSLAFGDFNADGKLDLATANLGDVSVMLGNGNGTFGSPSSINLGASGYLPSSVAVGDFNADGKLDLAIGSSFYYPAQPGDPYYGGGSEAFYTNNVNVLLGNGTGTMSFASSTALGGNYASASNYQRPTTTVAVADFNADGRGDVVATSSNDNNAVLLLGNLNGTLSYSKALAIGFNSQAVIAKDISGDGKADIAATNSDGIAVLLGDGLGSFGAAQNYATESPGSLALGDFNGDGKIDLLTADGSAGTVGVLLGAGGGSFKPALISSVGLNPRGVSAGDINGDGLTDLAAANTGSDNVSVLFNDGVWLSLSAPSLTINDVTVSEGNTGTVSATFTVTLSAAYGQTVSVLYTTFDGSAMVAGSDFQATTGTLTFDPGDPLTQNITVLINSDRLYENTENFYVRLSNSTNAFLSDAKGVGTIVNDEPSISIEPYVSGAEGNAGTKAFEFKVTLSQEYDGPVTVDYSTVDLTPDQEYWYGPGATAGVDYTANNGKLTFFAGETTKSIFVQVNGDRVAEGDELFFVQLSNPTSAQIDPYGSSAFGTILNDEPYVSISGGGEVVEGNAETKSVTFTVTLTERSDVDVTVSYTTLDGSALSGSDYQAATATVTIPAGQLSTTFTVLVNGDLLSESTEYFYATLTGATGAVISEYYAYASIIDDDTPPAIAISDASVVEGNSGTKLMTFTVSLSKVSGQGVWVNFATANGTATTSNNDYVAMSGSIYFAPGETSKSITITIKGDTKKEKDERFYVNLSGASGGTILDRQGVGTILNDDGVNSRGNKLSSAMAIDAAIEEMLTGRKKRLRR